ncbi:unnamed protein product [Symbiodinium sp. CCMP2456]|nr:unnamed protein product [Symbiodinium sp. CCMP2456]
MWNRPAESRHLQRWIRELAELRHLPACHLRDAGENRSGHALGKMVRGRCHQNDSARRVCGHSGRQGPRKKNAGFKQACQAW